MVRTLTALLLGGAVLSSTACVGSMPPHFRTREYDEMQGVEVGATAQEVRKTLGAPNAWRDGFWSSGISYQEDWQVWYYAGKGRVIFDRFDGRVVMSQADPEQPKHAVGQPHDGLY
ncbi:MAG TPA: hypothetical protein VEJ18_19725 [Planctomycetota bacterium]|nr:hypothetical protein [Planctomycetota bacterium]